jgi:hypothetical protein
MRNVWDVVIWRKGQENRENEEYVGRRNLASSLSRLWLERWKHGGREDRML